MSVNAIPTNIRFDNFMINFHKRLVEHIRSIKGYENFTCSLKLDWSPRRKTPRGGLYAKGPGVSYAMNSLMNEFRMGLFHEYPSFKNDALIGEFFTNDWTLIAMACSCHEVAHAMLGYTDKNNKEVHGQRWKYEYKNLRERFVNPALRAAAKVA